MDYHREAFKILALGLGAAMVVGAAVGHALDWVFHHHRGTLR